MTANLRPDGRESTHDLLCPQSEDYEWRKKPCLCTLIAKVRADEREKAAERLLSWFAARRIDVVDEATAAVRADGCYPEDRIVTVDVNEDGLRYIKKRVIADARGDDS